VAGVEVVAGSEGQASDLALAAGIAGLVGNLEVKRSGWDENSPELKEVPTDVVMRRIGAPLLPGFEAVGR
jgi:hypothetical protein